MRKAFLCALLVMLIALCVPAFADTYVIDSLFASVTIPDDYIVLKDDNLSMYADWLEARGTTTEEKSNDFIKRGVLLQAINRNDEKMVFELRAAETEQSKLVFDINEQTAEMRAEYRLSHFPNNIFDEYEFSSSEWKNTEEGRFLILKYIRRDGSEIVNRGLMRRTIRNGYSIDFDMIITDRAVTAKDNTALNTIWQSFHFIQIAELPPASAARINFTNPPPAETKNQNFNIEGTAVEGVHISAVVMGLSYPEPVLSEVTVGKNGKFSIPVYLPREGVFLTTITAEYKDQEVLELAYPVTYQRTLLTVNFTKKPDTVVNANEVKFAGTAEPGATVQVFVAGSAVFSKRVNTAGKFAFTVDCDDEGEYEVGLVFSKKGLADRRFTFNFTRRWNDADMLKYLKKQAISPSYATLTQKIAKYEGRILTYKAYIVDVGQSGDEYILRMALSRKNKKYSSIVLVTASEEPTFPVGTRVQLYGTCEGMSISTETDEGTTEQSYPCMELLLLASLN